MSDNILTRGLIAILHNPMSEEAREHFEQENSYGFTTNYEGTLLIEHLDTLDLTEAYGLHVHRPISEDQIREFTNNCFKAGADIYPLSVRVFTDIWYNGTDSNYSTVTHAQFMETIQSGNRTKVEGSP